MPRTFSATELAVGIGVSALVGLGLGYAVGKSGAYTQPDADIVLSEPAGGGPCEPSYPTAVSAKNGSVVTWHVQNTCKANYFVRLNNFRRRTGGSLGNAEVIINPGAPEREIPQNQTIPITANVTLDPAGQKVIFKYDIDMKAKATEQYRTHLDPDFEIWP